MAEDPMPRARYGEAFWRVHHEAWQRSDLNQYCEAQGLSLKAFGNWRAKFKAEPQPPARKLLYRRGGLSHTLSHVTYPSSVAPPAPVVLPPRAGHRRRFSEAARYLAATEKRGDIRVAHPDTAASHFVATVLSDIRLRCLLGITPRPSAGRIRKIVDAAVDAFMRAHAEG